MRPIIPLLVAAGVLAGACGDDDEGAATTTTEDAPDASLEVQDGQAIVEAGGERFEFIVHECLVGEETGSPTRRLALSASQTEPFLEADVVLNVDILVSQAVPPQEQHTITITRFDGVDLASTDFRKPAGGGLAPDDWIEVGDGLVTGSGFELRAEDLDRDDAVLADGKLVADCDSAGPGGE